jgi:CRP/FNR family cyclic AMP-dependent transcriptional regulator
MKLHDQKIELLARQPLFAECGRRELLGLAKACDLSTSAAGSALSVEGEHSRWWRVIVDGTATVSRDGRPTGLLNAGDWWGERSTLNGDPSSVTVVALTPVTVLTFNRRGFLGLLERHPRVARRVVSQLADRGAPYEGPVLV